MTKFSCLFTAFAFLIACSGDRTVPTAEENRQLDEAANLLNQAPATLETVDDNGLDDSNGRESANTL
jgi:hypothetical protein